MKPAVFSVETYAGWHERVRRKDRPLLDKLVKLRQKMQAEARPNLDYLRTLLAYMFEYSENEYRKVRDQKISYLTPLDAALKKSATTASYDSLFKSIPSVVNKMWRKSGDSAPTVTLDNILTSITDLSTDISTETMESARFLAMRLNSLPDLLHDVNIRAHYADHIQEIVFEPEMKMAAGYFAYHGLVRFTSGYIAEIQVYSALMSQWRMLSHQLYERVRLEPPRQYEFGSTESRLISLGHALHLAECEILRLRSELDQK